MLGAVYETPSTPTLKLGAQNTRRDRNWMDLRRDATKPKEVHREEHSDYFTSLLRADNVLIVTFPILLSFLGDG